jgi:large repetitive protein
LAGNTVTQNYNYSVSYASADLALAAGSLPAASVKSGTYITYGLSAKNQGPSAAQGVAVTDTLPPGATFSSGYILNGLKLTSCSSSGGVVTCPVGNLNNGAAVLAYITIKVPTTPGTVTNTITVGGLNPDPKPNNNSVTVTTKVTK